jgi:hypothetical protein
MSNRGGVRNLTPGPSLSLSPEDGTALERGSQEVNLQMVMEIRRLLTTVCRLCSVEKFELKEN